MRQAGYPLAAIAEVLGISARTIQRHLGAHSVAKGDITEEAIAAARKELVDSVTASPKLKHEIARFVRENMAVSSLIREKIVVSLDALDSTTHPLAAETARALAAYATSLKVTHDILKETLRLSDHQESLTHAALPELVVRGLTSEEMKQIHTGAPHDDQLLAEDANP